MQRTWLRRWWSHYQKRPFELPGPVAAGSICSRIRKHLSSLFFAKGPSLPYKAFFAEWRYSPVVKLLSDATHTHAHTHTHSLTQTHKHTLSPSLTHTLAHSHKHTHTFSVCLCVCVCLTPSLTTKCDRLKYPHLVAAVNMELDRCVWHTHARTHTRTPTHKFL